MFRRRGQRRRVDRIEPRIRLDDGRIMMMEASHAQRSPLLLSEMGSKAPTQSAMLPAVWKLSPDTNATYSCTIHKTRNIGSKKSSTPKTHTGNKAQVACTFPLDPMASYEPVWGIWDEHDSDLQWAGAALFMWERKTRGIVSRASGPAPGIWRTHVHTPGPKHTHLAHMLPKRDWYYIRRRIHFSDGGQGRRDKCWAHETLSKLFLGHKKESIGSMTSVVSNSVWAKGAKMMKGFLMATITIACLRRSWWLQHRHLIYSICLVSLQYHLLNLMVGYWLCLRVWSHLYINSLCHHISGVPASIVVSAPALKTWD